MLKDMHVGDRASELLDGRLTPAQEEQIRRHVGHCVRCARQVQAERQVRALLRDTGKTPASTSEELLSGLLQVPRGAATRPTVRQPGRRAKVGLLAAGAVVTLAVATPVAAGAGTALASVVPHTWLPQPRTTVSTVVVVPAGPGAGAHTTIRFESPPSPSPRVSPTDGP